MSSIKPATVLFAGVAIAFAPWLMTSGNGRYFVAFILVVGPLCLGLVYLLPMTRGFRLTLAACLFAVQSFAVYESDPLKSWGMIPWREAPYFQIELPQDMATVPGTYITLSSITYSLMAPLFPEPSSWLNIASAPTDRDRTLEGRRTHAILSARGHLTLLVPSIPEYSTSEGLPDVNAIRSLNLLLADHRLAISDAAPCRLIRSGSIVSMPLVEARKKNDKRFDNAGFWACSLRYPVAVPAARPEIEKSRFDAVFDKLESICPRFFRPGEARTKVINGGELRQYSESDMKVYVLDDGAVLYKYLRTFSPQLIGTVDDVMSGKATVACDKIRGRSGLPWEREI
ncbi:MULTISPECIES: hypothetical protein [unclassified Polaromonas]|uniref:hypothetical protein n=1 Tax=unclassified Polaromonas TaxID=2638319 RepID=UPI00129E8F16|nr:MULTISPECIES: hypothetical protein [unclassified Polaromonas]QGJ17232.1 hypothetical protein F7R28_01745 [Polaromonas sp. Pch-P]